MPYVVTTKRPQHADLAEFDEFESRRAVATLEEARELAVARVDDQYDAWSGHELKLRLAAATDDARALPESGGTVGPLPDGTVVKVQRVDWRYIDDLGFGYVEEGSQAALAAFNAPEEVRVAALEAREAIEAWAAARRDDS